MIIWREDLWFGEEAEESGKKIIENIINHKLQFGVFVITLAVNGRDIFDIIPSFMLSENGYKGRDIEILGLAKGKDEAKELCRQMIMEVYEQTGGFNVREYYSQ